MKNKAIVLSLLLNTCIATNAHANTIDDTNYFYFGSKFNTLQPNHIKQFDGSNFKNLYTNYWSHSLYGFLIGYQSNSYFGLEVSYNNPFINQDNHTSSDALKKEKRAKNIIYHYMDVLKKDREQKDAAEEAEEDKLYSSPITKVSPLYVNTSNSYSNDNSLFPIKNHIKKIQERSEYTANSARSTDKNALLNHKKNNQVNIIYPQKNLEIVTKLSCPILNSIDLYSRLGCSINLNKNLIKIRNSDTNYSFKNDIFPLISVGLQYKINQNFYSRIEFEKKITYYSNTKSDNLNSINFHFIWNFQGIFSDNTYNDNQMSLKYSNELKNLNFKQDL